MIGVKLGVCKCPAEGLAPSARTVLVSRLIPCTRTVRGRDWLLVQFLGSSRKQWGWGLRKEQAWSQEVNVSEHKCPCGEICRESTTAVLSVVFFQW